MGRIGLTARGTFPQTTDSEFERAQPVSFASMLWYLIVPAQVRLQIHDNHVTDPRTFGDFNYAVILYFNANITDNISHRRVTKKRIFNGEFKSTKGPRMIISNFLELAVPIPDQLMTLSKVYQNFLC